MTDADHADDRGLLANTTAHDESLLHCLKQAAGSIGLYVYANKTEFICFKQDGVISILSLKLLKLADLFTSLASHTSSTDSDVIIRLAKM